MRHENNISPNAKAWVYQASRLLTVEEVSQLEQALDTFTTGWTSHQKELHATGFVHRQHFIVLVVDEKQASASGCSIDASVHFLKSIESQFGIQLFDRSKLSYLSGSQICMCDIQTFKARYKSGEINDSTQVFDNLVNTWGDFQQSHLRPLAASWHKRFVS